MKQKIRIKPIKKNNKKLIITWVPDVLNMIEHNGSHEGIFKFVSNEKGEVVSTEDNSTGHTSRSERESFRVKNKERAQRLLSRRNKNQIQFATYNGEVIYSNNE